MKRLAFALLTCSLVACSVQSGEHSSKREPEPVSADTLHPVTTTFPQVHTNLGGRVREFVRSFHHDSRGHYWFGTNGGGLIRYDGRVLETLALPFETAFVAVRGIAEGPNGHLWFETYLNGVWKYDGARITHYPFTENGTNVSTYSIYKDRQGVLWVGTHEHGAWRFNGNAFERHFNK